MLADTSGIRSRRGIAPWDMTALMRHTRVCDTLLKVAEENYVDLLPRVREDLARAMSVWFIQDGYRAEIEWSDIELCFVGRIRLLVKDIEFKGVTPSELQRSFKDAVHRHVGKQVILLPAPSSASQLERCA